MSLGCPSLLWVQLGQSWAVHPWRDILHHHQGAPVYLSPLEVPSGPWPLLHPFDQPFRSPLACLPPHLYQQGHHCLVLPWPLGTRVFLEVLPFLGDPSLHSDPYLPLYPFLMDQQVLEVQLDL